MKRGVAAPFPLVVLALTFTIANPSRAQEASLESVTSMRILEDVANGLRFSTAPFGFSTSG